MGKYKYILLGAVAKFFLDSILNVVLVLSGVWEIFSFDALIQTVFTNAVAGLIIGFLVYPFLDGKVFVNALLIWVTGQLIALMFGLWVKQELYEDFTFRLDHFYHLVDLAFLNLGLGLRRFLVDNKSSD